MAPRPHGKAGVATQRFYVTVSYECGVYDELGNMIAIDEDCNSGNSQQTGQTTGGQKANSFIRNTLNIALLFILFN